MNQINLPVNFIKSIRPFSGLKLIIFYLSVCILILSCESEPYGKTWMGADQLTIGQYLEKNNQEYSKFIRILEAGKMLQALSAYNPRGNNFTLFLPTNDAIDRFIDHSPVYETLEDMLADTGFVKTFTRYHTLKKEVHTNNFPFGILKDSTLTGERLSIGFFTEDNLQLPKINNVAPVIQPNINLVNGYIHVISEVLQKIEIPGLDWLQQQQDYSILSKAIQMTNVRNRLWWSKYTILAEHDSIFNRYGIYSVEDLISRIATPNMSLTNRSNAFYKFAGYHIVGGEYYLNELYWGHRNYSTLDSNPLTINVGLEIKINPGIDTYGYSFNQKGDTVFVDYISLIWDNCNIITKTGPVHAISEVLFYQPVPK